MNLIRSREYVVFLPNISIKRLQSDGSINDDPDDERDISKQFATSTVSSISDASEIDDLDDLLYDTEHPTSDTDYDDIEYMPDTYDSNDINDGSNDNVIERININQLMIAHKQEIKWDPLPKFYVRDAGAIKTNLLCWSCSSVMKEDQWLLPTTREKLAVPVADSAPQQDPVALDLMESDKSKHSIHHQILACKTVGIFCNVMCMGRYLMQSQLNTWQTREFVKIMFREKTGKELREIPVASDPHAMAKYCGPSGLTEQQYYDANMAALTSYIK
jgi:hypothetical protein